MVPCISPPKVGFPVDIKQKCYFYKLRDTGSQKKIILVRFLVKMTAIFAVQIKINHGLNNYAHQMRYHDVDH